MSIVLNGTTGITTPDVTSDGLTVDSTTLVVDEANNQVGIGTDSPSNTLHLSSTSPQIRLEDTDATGYSKVSGSSANIYLQADEGNTAADSKIDFRVDGSQRMILDSSGNLLVGTTSNPDANRVVIKGGDGTQLYLDNAGTTYTQLTFANNGTRKVRQFFDNSLTRFYIDCNGTGGVYLSSGATSWTAASDERVKDIIEPIENATQKLSEWRTVVGKYKADAEGTRRSFLIAQDVLATFPEAVDTTNADEYGLNYQDVIPVLVKAIQEQQAIIEEQKTALEALTARVSALEAV